MPVQCHLEAVVAVNDSVRRFLCAAPAAEQDIRSSASYDSNRYTAIRKTQEPNRRENRYAVLKRLAGKKRISTRLSRASAIRLSIESECPS